MYVNHITLENHFLVNQYTVVPFSQEAMLEYNHKVYLMPWCRAGPYLVGAWAGYVIHKGREAPSLARLKTVSCDRFRGKIRIS